MRELAKRSFYFYQRLLWYVGFTAIEAKKPLVFINEALLLFTFLAVQGVKASLATIGVLYVVVMIGAAIVGKLIVYLGVVEYNNRLGNSQNPEIKEILERVKAIEEKLQ